MTIGNSSGRHIYVHEDFLTSLSLAPILFFDCGIHAREWISPATCLFLIQDWRANWKARNIILLDWIKLINIVLYTRSIVFFSTQLGAGDCVWKQRVFAEEAGHEEVEAPTALSVADCPHAQSWWILQVTLHVDNLIVSYIVIVTTEFLATN